MEQTSKQNLQFLSTKTKRTHKIKQRDLQDRSYTVKYRNGHQFETQKRLYHIKKGSLSIITKQ